MPGQVVTVAFAYTRYAVELPSRFLIVEVIEKYAAWGILARAKARLFARYRVLGGLKTRYLGQDRVGKKSLTLEGMSPQRLKPGLFATTYVRAEARTLQKS
jgi:hypothetical protein